MMIKPLALALMLAILAGSVARADPETTTSAIRTERVWRAQDACAKKAFKQYPDYTPEGNAKRAQAKRLCLATGNLPPRDEQPVPPVQADGRSAH